MKQVIFSLLMMLLTLTMTAQVEDFSSQDLAKMQIAVKMVDSGQFDVAIEIFKEMDKKYPNNYNVLYELAFAYNHKRDYKQALKICKKLTEHPWANHQAYQMLGNILDDMGKPEEAVKAYKDGLNRFPDAGELYLEQGILRKRTEEYNQAVECFEKAIEVEPSLPSPYYHLAQLFSMSTEPVWAIIYGEAARLLSIGTPRSDEMSKLVYDMYKDNISFSNNGDSIHVHFTENNSVSISPDMSVVRIPLPINFETTMLLALANEKQIDLPTLVEIRKRFIEYFYERYNGYYDVSILDFQRKVLESGNWEAYNMWLMQEGDPDANNKWFESDLAEEKIDAFASWYQNNYFMPTKEHPTLRTKTYRDENVKIPSIDEIKDAAGCRKHREDALRLAQWLLEQPYDSTDYTFQRARQFLVIWGTNSDEVVLEMRPSAVLGTVEGVGSSICALIEYALTNNVKEPGEEGYCYAVKRVLGYLDKNRNRLQLSDTINRYLKMSPDELDRQLHEDYKNYNI